MSERENERKRNEEGRGRRGGQHYIEPHLGCPFAVHACVSVFLCVANRVGKVISVVRYDGMLLEGEGRRDGGRERRRMEEEGGEKNARMGEEGGKIKSNSTWALVSHKSGLSEHSALQVIKTKNEKYGTSGQFGQIRKIQRLCKREEEMTTGRQGEVEKKGEEGEGSD